MNLEQYPMPIALEHCFIENSIVVFYYNTPYHWTHIQKMVVEAFANEGENLDEYPLVNEKEMNPDGDAQKVCFSTGELKLLVEGKRISFNCVSSYPGWEAYRRFIRIAMRAIPNEELQFLSVGVRYISRYENIPIFPKLDGQVSLNQYQDVNGAEIRFPIREIGNITGLVRVTNMLLSKDGGTSSSYADVDIRKEHHTNSVDEIIDICEEIHYKEKQYFFKLISNDFVQELGPVYE